MADTRTFTLIGKFDDQITPKLKLINKEIAKLSDLFKNTNKNFSQFNTGAMDFSKSLSKVTSAAKDAKRALDDLGNVKSSMKGAAGAADSFSKSLQDVSRSKGAIKEMTEGMDSFGHSAKKAHEETRGLLATILKAEALSKIGEGFAEGLQEGAHKTVEILHKGVEFMSERFKEAIEDEGHEVAAQMQYYSQIKAKNFFPDTSKMSALAKQLQDMKNVNIGREQYEIGEATVQRAAKGQPVSQETLTSTFRALTPYITPDVLKRMGVTGSTRAGELAKAMSTKKDPSTGKTYEQAVAPGMIALSELAKAQGGGREGTVIREVQEFVESGMMKAQALAWQNPLFRSTTKELTKKYTDQGLDAVAARGKAVLEAATIAVPKEAMGIASQTVQAGMAALQQSVLSPKTGIFSLNAPMLRTKGADGRDLGYGYGMAAAGGLSNIYDEKKFKDMNFTKEYMKTEQFKGSAYGTHYAEIEKHYADAGKEAMADLKKTGASQAMIAAKQKELSDLRLVDEQALLSRYQAIHSPMDMITAELGTFLLKLGMMFGNADNAFIQPVVSVMNKIGKYFASLDGMIDSLGAQLKDHKITLAEAIGKLLGDLVKAVADIFNPKNMKGGQDALQQVINEFMKGFKSVNGDKAVKELMSAFQGLLMKVFFKGGDITKGLTPISTFLIKLFAAMSAPSIITAIISGVTPLIIESMGHMIFASLGGIGAKIGAQQAAKVAAKQAAEQAATQAAENRLLTPSARILGLGGTAAKGATALAPALAPEVAEGAAGLAGLSAVPVLGWIAAVGAAVVIFEKPIMKFSKILIESGRKFETSGNWVKSSFGQVLHGVGKLFKGITEFFNGLWETVSGLMSGDKERAKAGIKKLFTGIGDIFVGIARTTAGLGGIIVGAIGNLFQTLGAMIKDAAPSAGSFILSKFGIGGGKPAAVPKGKPPKAKAYGGAGVGFDSLAGAIGFENAHKPSGSSLVVANSSETVIPAANGTGTGVKDIVAETRIGTASVVSSLGQGFQTELKLQTQSQETNQTGFKTMQKTTKDSAMMTAAQVKSAGDKTANTTMMAAQATIAAISKGYSQIQAAVQQAISASGGGGGGGLDLGGLSGGGQSGSASFGKWDKNLMAATAAVDKKYGVPLGTTASIFMFESSGSTSVTNSIGATGLFQVMPGTAPELGTSTAAIRKMGGVQQTALFDKYLSQRGYRPGMGPTRMYSTVLAGNPYAVNSRDANSTSAAGAYPTQARYAAQARAAMGNLNQANALGPNMPMFFGSKSAARDWESKMAPSGSKVKTFTTNTAEMGGGPNINNSITIHQQPNQDPDHLASLVVQKMGEWVSEARASTIFV